MSLEIFHPLSSPLKKDFPLAIPSEVDHLKEKHKPQFIISIDFGSTNLKIASFLYWFGQVEPIAYQDANMPDAKKIESQTTVLGDYEYSTLDWSVLKQILDGLEIDEQTVIAVTGANNCNIVTYGDQVTILPERPNLSPHLDETSLNLVKKSFRVAGYSPEETQLALEKLNTKPHYLIQARLALMQDPDLRQQLFGPDVSYCDLQFYDLQSWVLRYLNRIQTPVNGDELSDQNARSYLARADSAKHDVDVISQELTGHSTHLFGQEELIEVGVYNLNDLSVELRFLEIIVEMLQAKGEISGRTAFSGLDTVFKVGLARDDSVLLESKLSKSGYVTQEFGGRLHNWSKAFCARKGECDLIPQHFVDHYPHQKIKEGRYDYVDLLVNEFLEGNPGRSLSDDFLFYPVGRGYGRLYQKVSAGEYELVEVGNEADIKARFDDEVTQNQVLLAVSLGTAFAYAQKMNRLIDEEAVDNLILYGGLIGNGHIGWRHLYQELIIKDHPELQVLYLREFSGAAQGMAYTYAADHLLTGYDQAELMPSLQPLPRLSHTSNNQFNLQVLSGYQQLWEQFLTVQSQQGEIEQNEYLQFVE